MLPCHYRCLRKVGSSGVTTSPKIVVSPRPALVYAVTETLLTVVLGDSDWMVKLVARSVVPSVAMSPLLIL